MTDIPRTYPESELLLRLGDIIDDLTPTDDVHTIMFARSVAAEYRADLAEAAARIRTLEGEAADLRAELLASRASTAAAVEHGGKGWRKAATAESQLERAREALGKIALLSDQKNEPTDVSDRLHYWRDKTIDAAILARGGLAGIRRLAMEGGGG